MPENQDVELTTIPPKIEISLQVQPYIFKEGRQFLQGGNQKSPQGLTELKMITQSVMNPNQLLHEFCCIAKANDEFKKQIVENDAPFFANENFILKTANHITPEKTISGMFFYFEIKIGEQNYLYMIDVKNKELQKSKNFEAVLNSSLAMCTEHFLELSKDQIVNYEQSFDRRVFAVQKLLDPDFSSQSTENAAQQLENYQLFLDTKEITPNTAGNETQSVAFTAPESKLISA